MKTYKAIVVTHDSNKTLKDDLEYVKGSEILISCELEEMEKVLDSLDLDKDKDLKYRWLRRELNRMQKA